MTQVSWPGGRKAAPADAVGAGRRARRALSPLPALPARVTGIARAVAAVAALLAAAGCAPTLDWRQLRPEGWGLALSLPCRPASHARSVALAGAPVELQLMACSADEHTFAAASADVADPARVGPALQALGAAAQANVQGRVEAEQAAAVSGMTPHPAARRWRLAGRLPDGRAVREQVLVFSHGTRVFQLTVLGPRADDALARPLLDAAEVLR